MQTKKIVWGKFRQRGREMTFNLFNNESRDTGFQVSGASKYFMHTGKNSDSPAKATAYVRVSSKNRRHSKSSQMDVIRAYAKRRGLEILKIYSERAKVAVQRKSRSKRGTPK